MARDDVTQALAAKAGDEGRITHSERTATCVTYSMYKLDTRTQHRADAVSFAKRPSTAEQDLDSDESSVSTVRAACRAIATPARSGCPSRNDGVDRAIPTRRRRRAHRERRSAAGAVRQGCRGGSVIRGEWALGCGRRKQSWCGQPARCEATSRAVHRTCARAPIRRRRQAGSAAPLEHQQHDAGATGRRKTHRGLASSAVAQTL